MASEQIRVSPETWRALNSMKDPGDSFDDVIKQLIDENDFMKFVGGELEDTDER